MTLDERIAETEQKFNTNSEKRDSHVKAADECLTEMTKLQGEWRILNALKDDAVDPSVEVINAGKSKKESK